MPHFHVFELIESTSRVSLPTELNVQFYICVLQGFHICKSVLRTNAGDAHHHGDHFPC